MATLAEQIKKATHAMAGNPLNVADQGAYDSVFLKSPQIKHVMGPWAMTYANPSDHPNR
jgi:hypothetical protein